MIIGNESIFVMSPNAHIAFGRQGVLFVDVENGAYVKTNDYHSIAFAAAISSVATRAVRCADFGEAHQVELLNQLVDKRLGIVCSPEKVPYSHVFQPFEYIVDDIARWRRNGEQALLRQVAPQLLSELTVYVTGQCSQGCPHCHYLYRQVRCCNKYGNGLMPPSMLDAVLRDARGTALSRVHLVVPPDKLHQYSNDYGAVVAAHGFRFDIWTSWSEEELAPSLGQGDCALNVVVPLMNGGMPQFELNVAVRYHFCVASESELVAAYGYLDRWPEVSITVYPVYNGENEVFISDSMLLTEAEILQQHIGMRGIIRNKRMNANAFGELYMFANGEVRAAPYAENLANVTNITLSEIAYRELLCNDGAWLKTRSSLSGCSSCVYAELCPPPMPIDMMLGLSRRCHVE